MHTVASNATSATHHDRPFSVVIPMYNARETIIETLQSVLNQTIRPAEIIVIDDGSIDCGGQLVRAKFGSAVNVIQTANGGVSAARNLGIATARHPLVALIDADDTWAPHFLEEINQLVTRSPGAGLYATAYQFQESADRYRTPRIRGLRKHLHGHLLTNYFAVAAAGDLPFNASSVVLNTAVLGDVARFPENEPMGEDQCLWARCSMKCDIAYSPRALSFYRRDIAGSACQTIAPGRECPFSQRLTLIAKNRSLAPEFSQDILRYTAAHLIDLARRNARIGNIDTARALIDDPRCRLKPVSRLRAIALIEFGRLKREWLRRGASLSADTSANIPG